MLDVIATYGIVPQSVFSGMNYGTDLPVQGELDAVLRGYVEAIVRNPNKTLTPVWPKGFDGILNAYLGEIPADYVSSITEGLWTEPVSVEVNRRVMDESYDLIISPGQVVPRTTGAGRPPTTSRWTSSWPSSTTPLKTATRCSGAAT